MSDFQKEELTLEETNKLRISLGLKPLSVDAEGGKKSQDAGSSQGAKPAARKDEDDGEEEHDPLVNQDERAARNYEKYQESLSRKREDDAVRDRIAKARNRRELNKKLQGRSLGEAEPSTSAEQGEQDIDAKKWIKAQKRKAKENAERRLREEAEAEEVAAAAARRNEQQDLSGLRVGHDIDDLGLDEDVNGRVLTLKDSKVLDDEDDELIDTHLAQSEQDRKNNERKKGAKKYTGLDDDEFEEVGGRKRGVLSKYDADIDGNPLDEERDVGFRLGGDTATRKERSEEKKRESERLLNRQMLDLDYIKNQEVSDYLQEGDVGFKKPKKKRPKVSVRVRLNEEDDTSNVPNGSASNADVEMHPTTTEQESQRGQRRTESFADAFLDDEDLAASLARTRRKQAKRTFQKMTPEQLARNLREQQEAEEAERNASRTAGQDAQEPMDAGNTFGKAEDGSGQEQLTFDDTSEFVRNIQATGQASPVRVQRLAKTTETYSDAPTVKTEPMSPTQPTVAIDADDLLRIQSETRVKDEDGASEDEEMQYDDEIPEGEREDDTNAVEPPSSAAEPMVGGGLASTLSYLKNQGLISEVTSEQREREQQQRQYDAWLAARRVEDKVREAELAASKAQGSAKDQATREYENRMRELEDARRAQDKFKNYTPDIDIKYHDEFGRVLNSHEAWKRLSHQFHGKLPGRKKQNQRLQRIEEERKQQKMLAGETTSGIANAFTDRTEKSGQAHMVLGVGNRNNAPQDMDVLGPNTLSRADYGKRQGHDDATMDRYGADGGAGTSSAAAALSFADRGTDSVGITSMVPRSTTARTKAGFAPVRNQIPVADLAARQAHVDGSTDNATRMPADASSSPTPPASKFKLAFGKRPASSLGGDAGTPAKYPRLDH